MVLFLERDQYVDSLVMGSGFRFDIHPFKTFPHLPAHGLSLKTGTQTYIGMKTVCFMLKRSKFLINISFVLKIYWKQILIYHFILERTSSAFSLITVSTQDILFLSCYVRCRWLSCFVVRLFVCSKLFYWTWLKFKFRVKYDVIVFHNKALFTIGII